MKLKKFLSLLLSAAMAFSLLTATAFAAAPAEEENGFFDFLLALSANAHASSSPFTAEPSSAVRFWLQKVNENVAEGISIREIFTPSATSEIS